MKQIRFIAILSFVLCLFVVTACTSSGPDQCDSFATLQTKAIQGKDPPLCASISVADCRDECYNYAATNAYQPDACVKISKSSIRDACYSSNAANTHNAALCDRVERADLKKICLDNAK